MKRSAPSLHLLAAAAASDTATTTAAAAAMSFPQPFRGGWSRGRRSFSDRPSDEVIAPHIVTGDSHFDSVRETNRRSLGQSSNARPFRPRAPTPPYFDPNQQLYGQVPPPFRHNEQSFRAVPPPPGLYQNQQLNRAVPPPFGPHYNQNPKFNRPNVYENQQFNRPNMHENQQFNRPNMHENQQFNRSNMHENQQFNRPNIYENQQFNTPSMYDNQQFTRPNMYDNQQFNRQNVHENQQFNRPNMYENQQLRPRPQPPKALNFRNWEYAEPGPAPHCERFTVLSYNILADYLAIDHQRKLYFHIPQYILDWGWRKRSILSELGWWSVDILCFQEVDRFQELEAELKLRGYSGIWKRRTGDPADGCAIFWLASRFKLVHEEFIEFKKFGLRDNVAQICVFESLGQQNNSGVPAPSASPGHSNKVVICNTHVLFNPKRGEIKLGQVRVLLDKADAVSKLWNNAPVVICGDFNSTPKSPLYNYVAEQRLDLSEVPRNKVSGQESATIPSPSVRRQDAVNSAQSSASVGERQVKDSKKILDTQKPHSPDKNSGIGFSACILSQTQSSVVNESGSSCTVIPCPENTNSLPIETHCGESPSSSRGDRSFYPVEGISQEVSSVESCQEDEHNKVTESGYDNANPCATSSSCQENLEAGGLSNVGNLRSENVMSADRPTIAISSDVSSTEPFSDSSNVNEVSFLESSEKVGSIGEDGYTKTSHEANSSCAQTCFDVLLDEKMDKLSLNEVSEGTKEDEFSGQDRETFLSQLLGEGGSFASDLSQFQTTDLDDASNELQPLGGEIPHGASDLDSELVDWEKSTYDPSAWTPMDIETATGNADCTVMEHNLKLTSAYREVKFQDFSGTRDSTGEPEVTSYHRLFMGTVDYIWHSEGLQTARVLAPIPKNAMQFVRGFPTKKWGSDHIALVSEFAFTSDSSTQDTSVRQQ